MHSIRQLWIAHACTIAQPVLRAAAEGQLAAKMPFKKRSDSPRTENICGYLEAVARTLVGIAPWLNVAIDKKSSADEHQQQKEMAELSRQAILSLCTPDSPDYHIWNAQSQFLVDAAFLAHAILRAPKSLNAAFTEPEKKLIINAFTETRHIQPYQNNWLLFSAMVECGIDALGGDADYQPVHYAINTHRDWYLGDATYGDGPSYHHDYYNSYVILPMLHDICQHFSNRDTLCAEHLPIAKQHVTRYAVIQERMIAADGSFPIIGRSICYRAGAFQLLSQAALQDQLPVSLKPAQVRGALTAVIEKTLSNKNTFDANGWLELGLVGKQEQLAEDYISTGSLYLCCAVFLALGLPETDAFWSDPDRAWTSQLIWSGSDHMRDHAI